jgi:ER membrane protein complex subunit 1
MRLCALLTTFLSCVAVVQSILADEANHVDYHHALLGIPQAEHTFFHRPSAASSASLLYSISEKAVLGAINPKDGSLVWRHPLADATLKPFLQVETADRLLDDGEDKAAVPVRTGLLAQDGTPFVVSYYESTVSSWDAMNGKLLWQKILPPGQHIRSAQLAPPRRDGQSGSGFNVVVLYGSDSGTIITLNGDSGAVVWEHRDTR